MYIIYRIYLEFYCLIKVMCYLNVVGIVYKILVDGYLMFFKLEENYNGWRFKNKY